MLPKPFGAFDFPNPHKDDNKRMIPYSYLNYGHDKYLYNFILQPTLSFLCTVVLT